MMSRVLAALAFLAVAPAALADQAISDPAHNPLVGKRPAEKVPFPAIRNWSTLKIGLRRTACFGWCPVYSVEISGDGTVTYQGERFVATKGGKSWTIPQEKVRALYQAFVKADFFWTFDHYRASITDLPTQIVTISFDGRSKTVEDYAGQRVGMPAVIDDLEQAIDDAAGTAGVVGREREP